ncbi:hypothetical protein EB077_11025, partial [bacterium]|nr:hypothetical protein [bacterium]
LDNIISVGALNYDKINLAGFSNYGKNTVDLASPGSAIYSTLPNNNNGYLSGTSVAAPFVTGTIGLMKSVNNNLSIGEIRWDLLNSVNKISALSDKVVSGGCLDTNNALRLSIGLNKINYINIPQEPSIVKVNINKVFGIIKHQNQSTISVIINGREVKNFIASGKFSEPLKRNMFHRGWNTVEIYENGMLLNKVRIKRIV